jgi:hypothetical protein
LWASIRNVAAPRGLATWSDPQVEAVTVGQLDELGCAPREAPSRLWGAGR